MKEVLTTFSNYGPLSEQRQAELINRSVVSDNASELAQRVAEAVRRELAGN